MSINPTKRRQTDRTEEALSALRKTSLELLVSEGVNGLKLSDIGIKAGYSRGIVNYHFGTKNDLLIYLLDSTASRGEALYENATGSGLSMLENVLDELILMVSEHTDETIGLLLLIHEASCTTDPKLSERLGEYNKRARQSLTLAISAERREISSSNKENADLAILTLALIRGTLSQWLAERDTFDILNALKNIKTLLPALLKLPPN